MADAVVSSGMKEAGYEYINLDGVPPPSCPPFLTTFLLLLASGYSCCGGVPVRVPVRE